jgi:hypothetical protein
VTISADAAAVIDRRISDRLPFPAEMVVVWNHDMDASHASRFRMIDAGDGGYRIHCDSAPAEGTTGTVLRVLPDHGRSLEQAVQVVWVRPCIGEAGFEAGLRRL